MFFCDAIIAYKMVIIIKKGETNNQQISCKMPKFEHSYETIQQLTLLPGQESIIIFFFLTENFAN